MLKNKIFSLLLCVLLMCATALCVNRALFGHSFVGERAEDSLPAATDSISRMPDGTVVINTGALSAVAGVSGYGGPVPLELTIKGNRIAGIKPLANSETPSFFERASALFSDYVGETPEDAVRLKVDAVSGATYSSSAIIANVNAGLEAYLDAPAQSEGVEIPWKMWVALAVTLAACVLPLFVRNRIYNTVQMIANIAVLGFWCGQFLDYTLMLRYLSEGIALPAGLTAVAMLVAAFIYPLFGKPQHYCNHICPLGSAQMLVAELCHYKIRIGARTLHALDWFRKILWAVLMLLLWADVLTGWMDLELFQAFMYESAPVGIVIAAALFVVLSAVVSRPYCRFVCPTGSLFKRAENIG